MHVHFRLPLLPALFISSLLACSPICPAQQLPDSPRPNASPFPAQSVDSSAAYPADSPAPLTLRQRFILQTKLSFSPVAFLDPAFEAGITMADPPDRYPREWSDGAGAFGRIYGSEFARHTTSGYAHFATAAILREDPRYFRYNGNGIGRRTLHALLFTLADRSDSGHRMLAADNFVGAASGGFIGMALEPYGFNDVTHAYQRSAVEFSGYGAHNLLTEFSPELTRLLVKCRLGRFRNMMPTPPIDTPPGNNSRP
jgi:hypothetical protein